MSEAGGAAKNFGTLTEADDETRGRNGRRKSRLNWRPGSGRGTKEKRAFNKMEKMR